jgi:hypothetical protein
MCPPPRRSARPSSRCASGGEPPPRIGDADHWLGGQQRRNMTIWSIVVFKSFAMMVQRTYHIATK